MMAARPARSRNRPPIRRSVMHNLTFSLQFTQTSTGTSLSLIC